MGLRERKKEKTRLALQDAAFELFLEQGYDSTTIDQIAAAADVSPRTFFRYFTGKDHLVLWFHEQTERTLLEALAERPADEPPFASMTHALRALLRTMELSTPEDNARFLKVRRLLDANPHLASATFARVIETERRLVEAIAARRGVDPGRTPLPHLVVTFVMAAMRIGFTCPADPCGPREIVRRMEETLQLVERSLRPGWDV
ncbi:TetR family transcriptional regulator [Nonomuraea sp. MCN248]|uniref:TetR family transcriptional regulator n=1 Tax=Nonomuraea corallina TaxID=2989783 RepID=A0ABT4SKK5_9ACTN|nr:TetR family transcriptional regulator [Nonomuraea corallina]MDA0637669.1 TetR family transcriptional regulator [Nonomuraea corallina]